MAAWCAHTKLYLPINCNNTTRDNKEARKAS